MLSASFCHRKEAKKRDFFKDCFRNMICDILIVKFSRHLIPMTFYLKVEKHFLQLRSIFFSPLFFPFKQLKIFSIFRTKTNICASTSFLIKLQNEYPELCFTEGLTQVSFREFWEFFKNIYLRTVVASSFLINISEMFKTSNFQAFRNIHLICLKPWRFDSDVITTSILKQKWNSPLLSDITQQNNCSQHTHSDNKICFN